MWIERHHVKKKYFSSMKKQSSFFCTVNGTKKINRKMWVWNAEIFYGKQPTKPMMHMKLTLVNLELNNESWRPIGNNFAVFSLVKKTSGTKGAVQLLTTSQLLNICIFTSSGKRGFEPQESWFSWSYIPWQAARTNSCPPQAPECVQGSFKQKRLYFTATFEMCSPHLR